MKNIVRSLCAVVVLLLLAALGMGQNLRPGPSCLTWKSLASQYSKFDEIKPILLNDTGHSVFLSRIWPHGYGQLQRFNEESAAWEVGNWSGGCGVVKDAVVPIEIEPGTERPIDVYWRLSMDSWEKPEHFTVANTLATRLLKGRYRILLRYALHPWTLAYNPGTVYVTLSPEFLIVK